MSKQTERENNALFIVLNNTNLSEVVSLGKGTAVTHKKLSKTVINIIELAIDKDLEIPKEHYDEVEEALPETFKNFLDSDAVLHQLDVKLADKDGNVHLAQFLMQKTHIA